MIRIEVLTSVYLSQVHHRLTTACLLTEFGLLRFFVVVLLEPALGEDVKVSIAEIESLGSGLGLYAVRVSAHKVFIEVVP